MSVGIGKPPKCGRDLSGDVKAVSVSLELVTADCFVVVVEFDFGRRRCLPMSFITCRRISVCTFLRRRMSSGWERVTNLKLASGVVTCEACQLRLALQPERGRAGGVVATLVVVSVPGLPVIFLIRLAQRWMLR
jgi:hypothetical protein